MGESGFLDGVCEFYEASERLAQAGDYLLSHLFPATVFIGCTECSTLICACDSGVQAVRRLRDALENYVKTERGEE